jgi:hypothetical protein
MRGGLMAEMYLYNGVKLPALPEWDEKIYTGAFMWERAAFGLGDASYNDHAFFLYCAADCCVKYPEGTGFVSVTHGRYIAFRATDDGWNQVIFDGESSHILPTEESPVFWTSTDLMNEDGTLYLAASEPVPVSDLTPDPTSMLMGWLTGRRIASQRDVSIESFIIDDVLYIKKSKDAVLVNGILEVK